MSEKTAGHSMPDSAFLTQGEVAKVLRVSQRHVANLQRKGLLPYIRLGRRVIFERSRLLKAIDDISTRTVTEVLG
jgi:excisionase family DNA binding protein